MDSQDGLWYKLISPQSSTQLNPLYILHTTPLDSSYIIKSLLSNSIDLPCDIVCIDLPNHGLSPDYPFKDLSFKNIAKLVDLVRIKLNHRKISILGHGIGGFICLYYTHYYKKHLDKLILSNSAHHHRYQLKMAWNIRDRYSKKTIQKLEVLSGKTDKQSLLTRFSYSLAVHFKEENFHLAEKIMDNCTRIATDAYVIISNYQIPKLDMRSEMQSCRLPTLILSGKHDVWPFFSIELLLNDIPQANYIEIDTGHFPMIEQPDKYWNQIFSWLLQEI